MKKDWAPTQGSFQDFLHWLDQGVDSGGGQYLEMHRRLAAYFDRKNCLTADELADETLARVAQKLQEKRRDYGTFSRPLLLRYGEICFP